VKIIFDSPGVATLSLVTTRRVSDGWSVSAADDARHPVGYITQHEHDFGIRYPDEPEQPQSFETFDAAVDYFAEYVWAMTLGAN
jgi:regulation of enolase protein 1 (concanavalin A-like superfamily)